MGDQSLPADPAPVVIIAGLGPGDFNRLPRHIQGVLLDVDARVIVRTLQHPAAEQLAAGGLEVEAVALDGDPCRQDRVPRSGLRDLRPRLLGRGPLRDLWRRGVWRNAQGGLPGDQGRTHHSRGRDAT